ncbi:beta family protein [Lentzea aerocolonigenes]|nr:hypothetical protein [Lentzea aerocolonigenes]
MSFRPLVVIKSKMGEFEALRHLIDRGVATPRVLVELLDSIQWDGRGQLLQSLVKAATQMAARQQPLWIDSHLLSPSASLARHPGGSFEQLDNRIESALLDEYGLLAPDVPAFIPVVTASAADDELRAVAMLQEHRPRPIVIRFRNLGVSARELDDGVRRVIRATRADKNLSHAIVDLGFVETVQLRQVRAAVWLAQAVLDRLAPQSITLLAGSIPATRHGFATTVRDRPEVPLWLEVAHGINGAEINYGDYGVVHPNAPRAGSPGPRTVYPYLYYTVPNCVIAMRRQPAKEFGNVAPGAAGKAFGELAGELVARPEFAGSNFSWGDGELARCRSGRDRAASSVSRWVAYATSHHLEHVAQRGTSGL